MQISIIPSSKFENNIIFLKNKKSSYSYLRLQAHI